jgi:hypothetical protein
MNNVKYPFYITSWYDSEPYPASAQTAATITSTTPLWKNITFKNIVVTNSTYAGIIYGLPEMYVDNVVFDNVQIAATTKGLVTNFVSGMVFKNCSSITVPSSKGNAIVPYEATISGINTTTGASTSCSNILVTGITVTGNGGATTITTAGGSLQMSAAVVPANATDNTYTWSVDKTTVAIIYAAGLLTAVSNGSVVVTATANDGSGVKGTATVTVSGQAGTGVTDVNAELLTVSPNPASNVLNISSVASLKQIEIVNLQGQVVKTVIVTSGKLEINISDLQPGVYIVRCGSVVTKFVKI